MLDTTYLESLGTFDVVYSWGVLHHTGDMWRALENVAPLVKPGGHLFLSIYNDQGTSSRIWKRVKRIYNVLPKVLRLPYALLVMLITEAVFATKSFATLRFRSYVQSWVEYGNERGMNKWHDAIDWVGGYPFEVAKPEEIFRFYRDRSFVLERLKTSSGGHGCNEFVFVRWA